MVRAAELGLSSIETFRSEDRDLTESFFQIIRKKIGTPESFSVLFSPVKVRTVFFIEGGYTISRSYKNDNFSNT